MIVPLIAALVAYRWNWKGGLIFVALGVAALAGIWVIVSLLVYPEAGAEHRLRVAAGLAMLVWPASLAWSALAVLGAMAGLFVRLLIARKPA